MIQFRIVNLARIGEEIVYNYRCGRFGPSSPILGSYTPEVASLKVRKIAPMRLGRCDVCRIPDLAMYFLARGRARSPVYVDSYVLRFHGISLYGAIILLDSPHRAIQNYIRTPLSSYLPSLWYL